MTVLFRRGHSFRVVFSVAVVVCAVSSSSSSVPDRGGHRRAERAFRGFQTADDDFPYVVYLKTLLRASDHDCVERPCTGTLIHRRFVITVNGCVNGPAFTLRDPNDVKIFLKTRPYGNIENGMSYNVGQLIKTKPSGDNGPGRVALILMNDTFARVAYFPKIHYLQPIAEKTPITCTTVGFSLVGRNVSAPNVGPVRPMSYTFQAQLSVNDCVTGDATDDGTYMCHTGPGPLEPTLCEQGDEGSPLLCRPPANETADDGTTARPTRADEGLYLYGMANGVANTTRCRSDGTSTAVFLYVLGYGGWLNEALAEFDELDKRQPNATETAATAGIDTAAAAATSLPDYYDTDDYDMTMKKPIRCKGRYRLAMNGHNAVSIGQQLAVVITSDEHNRRRRRRRRRRCPELNEQ